MFFLFRNTAHRCGATHRVWMYLLLFQTMLMKQVPLHIAGRTTTCGTARRSRRSPLFWIRRRQTEKAFTFLRMWRPATATDSVNAQVFVCASFNLWFFPLFSFLEPGCSKHIKHRDVDAAFAIGLKVIFVFLVFFLFFHSFSSALHPDFVRLSKTSPPSCLFGEWRHCNTRLYDAWRAKDKKADTVGQNEALVTTRASHFVLFSAQR